MKTLPPIKLFTGDGYGAADPLVLTRLRASDKAFVYIRTKMKNPLVIEGYEVFKRRVIKAGAKLPNSVVVTEDYEKYPTKNGFGRWAWGAHTEERALQLFELLNQTVNLSEIETTVDTDEDDSETVIPAEMTDERRIAPSVQVAKVIDPNAPHRGRKRKETAPIQVPEGEFTMQAIADLNKMDKPLMYIRLKELMTQGLVKEVRRESKGKGRPTAIFKGYNGA